DLLRFEDFLKLIRAAVPFVELARHRHHFGRFGGFRSKMRGKSETGKRDGGQQPAIPAGRWRLRSRSDFRIGRSAPIYKKKVRKSAEFRLANGSTVSIVPMSRAFRGFQALGRHGTTQLDASMKRCCVRMPSPAGVLAAGLTIAIAARAVAADSLDQWYRRNPLPTAGRLFGVAYGNNNFIAVGLGGAVAASSDGTNWVSQNSGTSGDLYGVTYGNGVFVAVGGLGLILSSDGLNWTPATSGTDALLNGVTYGDGTFVAVGDIDIFGDATILTSSDGTTWAPASLSAPGSLTAVAYADAGFVAVGEGGVIFSSSDTVTWTVVDSGTQMDLNGITYGNGVFAAVGGTEILTSPDGVTWSVREVTTTNDLYAISFGEGHFVTAGSGVILVSTNAIDWTRHDLEAVTLWGLAHGDGMFAAVGSVKGGTGFSTSAIYSSTDAAAWSSRTSGVLDQVYYGVAYGNGRIVAVGLHDGASGTGAITSSSNGANWTRPESLPTASLAGVAYGAGLFVAVGSYTTTNGTQEAGRILTSPDGVAWLARSVEATPPLSAVGYGNGLFVAVGGTNVLTSSDGVTWNPAPSGTANA